MELTNDEASRKNNDGTVDQVGTLLTQPRSATVLGSDPATLKRHMRILRKKFGADTPIGHRCSNVEGAIFNLQHAIVPGPTGEFQRANLEKAIKRGLTEIAQLAAQS